MAGDSLAFVEGFAEGFEEALTEGSKGGFAEGLADCVLQGLCIIFVPCGFGDMHTDLTN